MNEKHKPKASQSRIDFTGYWVCVSEWESDVALEICKSGRSYKVRAVDQADGEEAEIHDVTAEGEALYFAAYWSTGRFTKYKIQQIGQELQATYTFTDITYFKRVDKSGVVVSKRRARKSSSA